jgi:hypothetical protein
MPGMDKSVASPSGPHTAGSGLSVVHPVLRRPGDILVRTAMFLAWMWVLVLVSLGVWASYWAVLRDDHYQLIYLGQRVLDGGTYYIDCWENKPPGIAWINAIALALAGGRPLGAWIAPGVVAVAVLALTSWGVSRVLGRVAAIGLLFTAGVVMTMRVYDAPSINPDFYSAAFALAAITLFVVALSARARAGRTGLAVLAGLMWAGAT